MLLISCVKDSVDTPTIILQPIFSNIDDFEQEVLLVTASLRGFVADENEQPIPDAIVSYSDDETITDEYGHFFIEDNELT